MHKIRVSITLHTTTRMSALVDEESDWEQLNRTNWRGLGLTDPIKSVEVCIGKRTCVTMSNSPPGQVAVIACLSQSQGSSEATHRFVQLLC